MPPSLIRSFLRWRSGRGFGIHSPFAYRFVTEVLRQPCAFYAYAELPDAPSRLLLRLVVALRPATVTFYGCGAHMRRAVSLADSRTQITECQAGADFVVADCKGWSRAEVDALFAADKKPSALLLNCAEAPGLGSYGMTFDNCHGTVVVAPLRHLPRQSFAVRF